MEVELADEFGNLKNIGISGSKYANQVLNVERESLVLIQANRNATDVISTTTDAPDDVTFIPLLNNKEIVTPKFKGKIL